MGLSDGTLIEKRRASIGFDKAAEEWLRLHSEPNLRSHDDNVERYEKHVKPIFGTAPLVAITPARVLELRAKLQAKTRTVGKGEAAEERRLAARTVNLTMALVRSILRFAVANGHIPASPTDRIGRGKLMLAVDKTKLAPPVESAETVGRLLDEIRQIGEETNRPSVYGLFATLVYTGLRRGEACGLRWSDVDFDRRLITVRRSYEGRTKSGKDRMVPISAELVPILQQQSWPTPGRASWSSPTTAANHVTRCSPPQRSMVGLRPLQNPPDPCPRPPARLRQLLRHAWRGHLHPAKNPRPQHAADHERHLCAPVTSASGRGGGQGLVSCACRKWAPPEHAPRVKKSTHDVSFPL